MNIYSKNATEVGSPPTSGKGAPPEPPWLDEDSGEEDAFNLSNLLHLVWTNIWLLVAAAALCAAVAAWTFYKKTPLYTASATVVIETEEARVVEFRSVVPSTSSSFYAMNTEILQLRSRDLVERIVDALALQEDPEFNPALRPPTSRWKDMIGYDQIARALGWPDGQSSGGIVGSIDSLMEIFGLGPNPPLPVPDPERAREIAISILFSKLGVSRVEETYAFRLTATTEEPHKAARIANKFAEFYVQKKREVNYEATNEAMKWLSARVVELKEELEAAEAAVERFASGAGLVSEEGLLASSVRLKSMRDRQAEQQQAAHDLKARIGQLTGLRAAEDFAALGDKMESPQLRALAERLANGAGNTSTLERFDILLDEWLELLRVQADQAETQASVLSAPIAELEQAVEAQSSGLVTLRQLKRESEAAQLVYEYSLRRMKEISVQEGIHQADVRILSRAVVPGGRSTAGAQSAMVRGGIVGLVLGFGLVFLRNMLRVSIRTPEELEAATGLRVMGVIPKIPASRPRALIEHIQAKPGSALAEAVRNLRTAIQLSDMDVKPQVIMVSSSLPGEGKTSLAISLAQSWAAAGKKVLLLDCDLRRGSLKTQFKIAGETGLIAVLSGTTSFDETVVHDDGTGIDVLIADSDKVTGVDVFGSQSFETFVRKMRESYDFIILDTPPVLAIPDARVVAQNADAVVYLVKWNSTSRRMVRSGIDHLRQVNVHVSLLALTQIDSRRMDRYGYYGYGYGYGRKKIEKYYSN